MKPVLSPLLPGSSPGPHLPLPLLRQYAAGVLPPEARHRVEAHTLDCPRCADVLAGLLQTDASTTDAALRQLRGRLKQRVAAPVRPVRRTGVRVSWLAPQLAAAVALLLVLLAGGWWAWQHRARQAATVATAPAEPAAAPVPAGPPAAPLSRSTAASQVASAAPRPVAGAAALAAYLQRGAAAYRPAGAQLHGVVRLAFTVAADGVPAQVAVRQSLRPDYDAEARRLLRSGPRWAGTGAAEVSVQF